MAKLDKPIRIRCIETTTGRTLYLFKDLTEKPGFMEKHNLKVQDLNVNQEKLNAIIQDNEIIEDEKQIEQVDLFNNPEKQKRKRKSKTN